jgi:hypothetical protein
MREKGGEGGKNADETGQDDFGMGSMFVSYACQKMMSIERERERDREGEVVWHAHAAAGWAVGGCDRPAMC